MKTAVIKRSININGNKTSVSLENDFWNGLHEISESKNTTATQLAGEIARQRSTVNVSSAIRLYVYRHFRSLERNSKAAHLGSASLRARAEGCRASARGLSDQEARAAMLRIAEDYKQMATNAARVERAPESDSSTGATSSSQTIDLVENRDR